ncbi:MAG: hypothetical protein JWP89_1951 [Schlesneria sp.]|nr:hypothetical protein [Schlesneria sp.]
MGIHLTTERTSALSRRQWLAAALVAVQQSGCGTIFWPERRGQPAGPLDLKVVALDAIGLLFFFIPGVIAFAVDFSTGAIYLPPGQYSSTSDSNSRWKKVPTATKQPDPKEIEQVVYAHSGKTIRLQPGTYQVGRLKSAHSLDDLNMDEVELASACEANTVRFRAQSE